MSATSGNIKYNITCNAAKTPIRAMSFVERRFMPGRVCFTVDTILSILIIPWAPPLRGEGRLKLVNSYKKPFTEQVRSISSAIFLERSDIIKLIQYFRGH